MEEEVFLFVFIHGFIFSFCLSFQTKTGSVDDGHVSNNSGSAIFAAFQNPFVYLNEVCFELEKTGQGQPLSISKSEPHPEIHDVDFIVQVHCTH